MLATLGDLVDDVVVRVEGAIQFASDTDARIHRRPGGSAANVAVAAARRGCRARFLGQVGSDPIGKVLVDHLASAGVDISAVRRRGSTGTVVVVVDRDGERTMLTDRRTCVELAGPERSWLDGVTVLHVPFYSLVHGPLSESAQQLIDWAHERRVAVSIDVSSAALIERYGVAEVRALLAMLAPAVILANEREADVMGISSAVGSALTVVKRGPNSALVHRPGAGSKEVPAVSLGAVVDSTGAGDAFAAGFLTHGVREGDHERWRHDPVAACHTGHRVAADLLRSRTPRP